MKKFNRKKIMTMILTMSLSAGMTMSAFAEETPIIEQKLPSVTASKNLYSLTEDSNTYDYEILDDGSVSIQGYKGDCDGINLCIPDKIDGRTVTRIDDESFYYCKSLTNITIPNSVKEIGAYAFADCTNLTDITIPNSVKEIGTGAFYDCTSLTDITISNTIEIINSETFLNCSSLTNITIPNSVKEIGDYTFEGCSSLKNITIPDSVKEIGSLAFSGCTSLICITIPNSVKEIGHSTFEGCSSLTNITIPNSVKEIGAYAFYDCTSLTDITIPDTIETIYIATFFNCTSLTNIIIPNSVKEIGNGAFGGCTSLTNITIPNNVNEVGDSAFSGCTNLTNITIPNDVKKIGTGAFSGCTSLNSINVDSSNKLFLSLNGILFNKEKTKIICVPGNKKGMYVIPNTVTSIEKEAFWGCTNITNITIPNSVKEIGDYAFGSCTSLTNITISNSVKEIGDYAFSDCTSLTNITIPNTIEIIYRATFGGCTSLTNITIPNSVKEISDYAFWNCTSLTDIPISNSVKEIGSLAFAGCTSLTSITIPNGVKEIGSQLFYDCTSLTCITIPNSVKEIGDSAFGGCTSLTNITIPDSVTTIAKDTFQNCKKLTIYGNVGSFAEKYAKNNKIAFKALKASINNATVSGITDKTYTGKGLTQSIAVKVGSTVLKTGKDYTVTYKNNTYLGTATVTIIGTGNYTGTITKTFLIKPKAVTGLKAASYSYNSIKLSWSKQSGATKYAVYRATSKKGTYKKIAYATSNYYINKSLYTGNTYYYKVRAIKTIGKTNYYGGYSSISYTKPVPAKTKVSLTAGTKKITVKWKKVSGASGYEVYRATSKKGKYTKVKTTNYKYSSFTNTKLASRKTYYYKVRAYKTVKGKKLYSSYSSIIYKKAR